MKTKVNTPTLDDLILQSLVGKLDKEAYDSLASWRNTSKKNEQYYQSIREIWFSSLAADSYESFDYQNAFVRFHNRIHKKKTVRLSLFWSRVAVVAILLIVSYLSYMQGNKKSEKVFANVVVDVPFGSKTKLLLPDSTSVFLNAGSKLVYSQGFGIRDRYIKLNGEAYFEVTKNPDMPFEVTTNNLIVQVLGTKFNLKNYDTDLEAKVNLLEGKIGLKTPLSAQPFAFLNPHEKMTLDKTNKKVNISTYQTDRAITWTHDEFFFDEDLLPDIVKELERNYKIKITLANEELKTYRFYGCFIKKEQTITQVLGALQATGYLKYKIENKKYILYKR